MILSPKRKQNQKQRKQEQKAEEQKSEHLRDVNNTKR